MSLLATRRRILAICSEYGPRLSDIRDKARREHGLAVDVTTRHVNQLLYYGLVSIGKPRANVADSWLVYLTPAGRAKLEESDV